MYPYDAFRVIALGVASIALGSSRSQIFRIALMLVIKSAFAFSLYHFQEFSISFCTISIELLYKRATRAWQFFLLPIVGGLLVFLSIESIVFCYLNDRISSLKLTATAFKTGLCINNVIF